MDSLESSVKDCVAAITSTRATDRKKNAEILKDYLTRNAVPSLLTENSRKKRGITWNDVFEDINQYILKETEKFETSKSFANVVAPLCTSLLHLCVSGSNKGKVYIKCDKVIDSCLMILQDNRLTEAIGDAYLSLLYKHILPYEYYVQHITPSSWEDLLNTSLKICLKGNSKLDDFTKLRLLSLIIRHGTHCCQIVIALRDSLPKMKKCFLKHMTDKKIQEVVTEIIILLLEQLSSECRLTMCEFLESVLLPILKYYDQNTEHKKKSNFFKLLQLTVIVHHPCGRLQSESGSLANDWEIWNKHMQNILEIICLETLFLQKSRIHNNLQQDHTYFYQLAASVYYQIFHLTTEANTEAGTSSKKQRTTYNKCKSFSDAIEELPQNPIPWFGIVHAYIEKYKSSVSFSEYLTLLNTLEDAITNNTVYVKWEKFEELMCLILNNLINDFKDDCNSKKITNIVLNLWNSCVRNSSSNNTSLDSLHKIMQIILETNVLSYQNVEPMLKLYFENAIPLTEISLRTLNCIFYKYFKKCSHSDVRMKCFAWWWSSVDKAAVDIKYTKEFMLRLLSNENVGRLNNEHDLETTDYNDKVFDTLYKSIEKSILFSELELDIPRHSAPTICIMPKTNEDLQYELNIPIDNHLRVKFEQSLIEYCDKLENNNIKLSQVFKFMNAILSYINTMLKHDFVIENSFKETDMYLNLRKLLKYTCNELIRVLEGPMQMNEKNDLLQNLENIFLTEFCGLLNNEVRCCVHDIFFKCLYNVMSKEVASHEDKVYEEDDVEVNPNALKHRCITVMAAYCRKRAGHRDEILRLILDYESYDFSSSWDIECAFQCIRLLNNNKVDELPIELLFTFMKSICKELFRSSKVTFVMLKLLSEVMVSAWSDQALRENVSIMVRGYVQRCDTRYYSPRVAARAYQCAARQLLLPRADTEQLRSVLHHNLTGEIHSIRLYCCTLLDHVFADLSKPEIDSYITDLLEIFTINTSNTREQTLKDEHLNRTLILLHCFSVLAENSKSLTHGIVTRLLQIQKDKSLDERLVKKVLNRITKAVAGKNVEQYLNGNILSVLHFWFTKNNSLDDFPLYLFGFEDMSVFLKKHMHCLIPVETLYSKRGDLKSSEALKQTKQTFGKSDQDIIENCFCSIITLSLPQILIKEHKLAVIENGELVRSADRMFHSTRAIIGDKKWSDLFTENIGSLVSLSAQLVRDPVGARAFVDLPYDLSHLDSYYYSKRVFEAILKYFSDLIDENIVECLCNSQPTSIFKTLFDLWECVTNEFVFEYKMLCLHGYMSFVGSIPPGGRCEAFVSSFTWRSIAEGVRVGKDIREIAAMTKALQLALDQRPTLGTHAPRAPLATALSIFAVKAEEGYRTECESLLYYLTVEMKDQLKASQDVLDFVNAMSQGDIDEFCGSTLGLKKKLESFHTNLSSASHEVLINLKSCLKKNKQYINGLYNELDIKGFSEDCTESIIHKIISSLCDIINISDNNKTKILACDCLATIGRYDLKTLVTVPPKDTKRITQMGPNKYFAVVVVKSLVEVMFDVTLSVTNDAVQCLNKLFSYLEASYALDCDEIDRQILIPFSSSNCNQLAEFKINELKFVEQFSSQFLIPRKNECHTHWLTRITDSLLEVLTTTNNYVTTLRVVCNSKPNMCRKILPALVGLLLLISSGKHIQEISTQINAFFDYIWEISFDVIFGDSEGHENNKNTISTLGHDHRMIVQYMLDIVDLVRLQKNNYRKRSDRGGGTGPLNYLGVRYDRVACAAAAATQHLPAIYYAEMHAAGDPSSTTLANDRDLQRILRKCFISIGEMDAIEGCGAAHLTEERERRNYLLHSGHYTDSLLMHDIALSHKESPASGLQCGLVTSLYKAGLHHVALQYINSLPENEQLDDVKYDCLSILGDWNDIVDTDELEAKSKLQDANINSIIKTFRYACLKDCLNIQSTKDCKLTVPLNKAKLAVSRLCQVLNMENCQSVYKTIEKLHLLTDIEDYFAVRCGTMTIYELLRQWRVDNLPACNDFKHLEALILQRNLILKHASKSYNNLMQEIVSLQLDYVEVGLSQQCVQMAQCLVADGRGRGVDEGRATAVRLAEARVAWARQHRQVALAVLGDLLQNNSTDSIPGPTAAIALRQYGTWMAESKCDNPKNIINKYLKKSLEMLNKNDHSATRVSVYYDVAKFADSEYKQVVSYMNSSTFDNKLKCVNNMKDTASNLQATQLRLTKDEYVAFTTNSKFSALDEEEIINTRAEKKTYLELAMRYYLLHLKQSEDNNLSMFRVISLWLDNTDHSFETEGESFEELLHAVPSRKFLSVLPQLAPRLSNDNTPFAKTLRQIIAKCGTEHPHHTLPILFSLKNSEKDKYILNASGDGSSARGSAGGGGGAARTSAAAALVSQLAAVNPRLATIIKQMDKLCDAIISFANYQPPSKETKQNIPSAENIHRLGHLNAIPVPIDNIAIRNDCNYSHISTLVSFESYFELVGGINCPKKIACTISDGRRKIMLIKGKDDLRQDAVMQQVFNIVNNLLENDPITSRSKLLIRTYKVVAMSRRSGALEWCAGTMPLSAFLCGPNGAHARYRPQDISAEAAAKKLKDCHDQRQSNAVKLSVFKSILRDFKPVFHYFFTEHYLDPVTWYERRLAYIKSVAASSMVGYILGLGDRHVNNILIDKNTAEVIHIDFGIAFEQGRTLRTEETVPFRLTQDIIAGFGSCGTEGTFRKCCEKTMQLLRDNQEILLTILEVLLYDPLYSWSVISTQPNTNGGEGKAGLAERTLLSVRSKLSGTEGGVAGGVAVSGQVAGLIRAATDPANLSRLFYGWRAYL